MTPMVVQKSVNFDTKKIHVEVKCLKEPWFVLVLIGGLGASYTFF